MKRFLPLVFLCAPLFAAEGDLLVVERSDAGGTSVTVVRATATGFVKLGAMAQTPGAIFAAAPSPGHPTTAAHLFLSVATAMTNSAQAYQYVFGKLPQPKHQWQGIVPVGIAAYAPDEAIAYDLVKNALVILRPDGFEYASADNFLGLKTPPSDITLARLSEEEIGMFAHEGVTPPRLGFPADYTFRRVHLHGVGKASSVVDYPGLRKIAGTTPLLSYAGAFFVTADANHQYVAHQQILGSADQTAHLQRFSVGHGTTLRPLAHVGGVLELLEVQMGDDLWELNADTQNGRLKTKDLFSTALGQATVRGNSHGPAQHRVLSVTPPLPADFKPYGKGFTKRLTAAEAAVISTKATHLAVVTARFVALWKDIYKADPGAEISVEALVMLLNMHPGASDWLYQLLTALPEGERTALGISKGFNFHAVQRDATLKVATLYDKLSELPNCAAVLAAKP